MSRPAKLRVCASCEWIFEGGSDCPKCGFGTYRAHYVYGTSAYKYARTQEPWFDRKIKKYAVKLMQERDASKPKFPEVFA